MNVAHNEHTGAKLQTKASTDAYRSNYDVIFGEKPKIQDKQHCPECGCNTTRWLQNHKQDCSYFPL
jgi:hypothetical protein